MPSQRSELCQAAAQPTRPDLGPDREAAFDEEDGEDGPGHRHYHHHHHHHNQVPRTVTYGDGDATSHQQPTCALDLANRHLVMALAASRREASEHRHDAADLAEQRLELRNQVRLLLLENQKLRRRVGLVEDRERRSSRETSSGDGGSGADETIGRAGEDRIKAERESG